MKIAIFGMGYVGSVNAGCFAELDHNVVCNDIKEYKVDFINKGKSPIDEPRLKELFKKHSGKNITAEKDIQKGNFIFAFY